MQNSRLFPYFFHTIFSLFQTQNVIIMHRDRTVKATQWVPTIAISWVKVKRVLKILQYILTETKVYTKFNYLTNNSLHNQVLVIEWEKIPFFPDLISIFHTFSRSGKPVFRIFFKEFQTPNPVERSKEDFFIKLRTAESGICS